MRTLEFPNAFTEESTDLREVSMSERGADALQLLHDKGFYIVAGLQKADVPEIMDIARDPMVREFCPNDVRRFSEPEAWLAKGRAAFLMRAIDTEDLVGYSWSGIEQCDELPDHPVTTAFRSMAKGTGLGLVIVTEESTRALHGANLGIGLETWASNTGAVKTYMRAGAQLMATSSEERNALTGEISRVVRPTQTEDPTNTVINGVTYRPDTRLFMAFPTPQ